MTWGLILLGFLLHCAQAAAVYSAFKQHSAYYWVMLAAANSTSFLWLYIAARTARKEDVLFYGTVWDFAIMAAYIVTPLLFAGLKLTPVAYAGLALTVMGIILLKAGTA